MGEVCGSHRVNIADPQTLIGLNMTLSLTLQWCGHWKHRLHDLLKVCYYQFC